MRCYTMLRFYLNDSLASNYIIIMLTIISFEFNLRNFTLILTHQFEIYIINHIQMVVECAMYALNDFTGIS